MHNHATFALHQPLKRTKLSEQLAKLTQNSLETEPKSQKALQMSPHRSRAPDIKAQKSGDPFGPPLGEIQQMLRINNDGDLHHLRDLRVDELR